MGRFALLAGLVMLGLAIVQTAPSSQARAQEVFGDWEVRILGAETPESLPSYQDESGTQRPQGKFVVVRLEVSNIGRQAQDFRYSELTLVDSNDRVFTADDATSELLVSQGYELGEFQPGFTYETVVVFDVPIDASGLGLSTREFDFLLPIGETPSGSSTPTLEPGGETEILATDEPTTAAPANAIDVAELSTRVAELESRDAPAEVAPLATRVAELEATLEPISSRVAELEAAVALLTRDDSTPAGSAATPVAVTDFGGAQTITGDLLLRQALPGFTDPPWPCTGIEGYRDIIEGAEVVVRDGNGAVIAIGRLGSGEWIEAPLASDIDELDFNCLFPFEVQGVPDSDFYAIEVSHRGALEFRREELAAEGWQVHFVLGDEG